MKDSIIIHNIMFCVLKYLLNALTVNHNSISDINIPRSYHANPYALSMETAIVSPIDCPNILVLNALQMLQLHLISKIITYLVPMP